MRHPVLRRREVRVAHQRGDRSQRAGAERHARARPDRRGPVLALPLGVPAGPVPGVVQSRGGQAAARGGRAGRPAGAPAADAVAIRRSPASSWPATRASSGSRCSCSGSSMRVGIDMTDRAAAAQGAGAATHGRQFRRVHPRDRQRPHPELGVSLLALPAADAAAVSPHRLRGAPTPPSSGCRSRAPTTRCVRRSPTSCTCMRSDPPAAFLVWPREARAADASLDVPYEPDRDIFGTFWQLKRAAPAAGRQAMKRITSRFMMLIATAAVLPLVVYGAVSMGRLKARHRDVGSRGQPRGRRAGRQSGQAVHRQQRADPALGRPGAERDLARAVAADPDPHQPRARVPGVPRDLDPRRQRPHHRHQPSRRGARQAAAAARAVDATASTSRTCSSTTTRCRPPICRCG